MFDLWNIRHFRRYDRYMEHPDVTPFYRAVDAASLGRSIAEARREAGMTQQDLARKLDVTRGTVVRLEAGGPVSMIVAMQAIRLVGRDVALVPRFSRLQVRT